MNAELALAIECCHSSFDDNRIEQVSEAADEINWDRFLATVRRHRVQGLAANALKTAGVELPDPHSRALSRDAALIIEQNLRATLVSVQLCDTFHNSGVPLLFIKGLTLAALTYSNPFLKMSADVDILVHQENLTAAAKLMKQLGYELVLPQSMELEAWHSVSKESVWRAVDGVHVELHTRLADNAKLITAIDVSSAQQLVELPHGSRLPTLCFEDLVPYLCVHGASSLWFRLKWITDLAALIHRRQDIPIRSLYQIAISRGAGRSAPQALLLADRLFDLLRNDMAFKNELESDRGNRLLVGAAWTQLIREREPTDGRLGTFLIHLTQLFLLPTLAFKFGELRRQLAAAIASWRAA